MTRRLIVTAVFAMCAAIPLPAQQLPAPWTSAPANVQDIVRRQMKGEKISAKDSSTIADFAKKSAIGSAGAVSPDVQALMTKAMSGQKLTADERAKLAQAMVAQRTGASGATPQMNAMVTGAANGKAPRKSQLDSMRAQGYTQGRAVAAKADSLLNGCPVFGNDSSAFLPLASRAALLTELRSTAATYAKALGPAASSKLVGRTTNAAGVGLWMIGQVRPSILVLTRAALASPTPRTLNNLGVALIADRNYRDARLILDAANRAAPGSPAVLANLGAANAGLGAMRSAEDNLRAAVATQPELAQARFNLATILKCGHGGSGGAAQAADAAQQGQTDWFNAEEDRDIRLMRADAGLPVSGPEAESQYTPKRPMLMTLGAPASSGSPAGDVQQPLMPATLEEFAKLALDNKYTNDAAQLSESAQSWHAEATRLRAEYAHRRQQWLAGATPTDIRVPMSHDAALVGLARRRSLMYFDAARSAANVGRDYAPAKARFDDAWKRAMDTSPKDPCPIVIPAARDAYAVARAAVSSNAARMDKILHDYAADARQWIGTMNDPLLIAASLNDVAGDADLAGSLAVDAANLGDDAMLPWALTCANYKPSEKEKDEAAKPALKKADPCPMGQLPPLDVGFASITLGCDGAEISIEAGVSIEAKYDMKTQSGSLFVGGGLKVPTGWDEPVTLLGQGANAAAGKLSAGGKAGMIFKFDGGGLTDAGFEFGMSGAAGKQERNYQVDLTLVSGLQLSNDMTKPLDGLASAMWDPPPRKR